MRKFRFLNLLSFLKLWLCFGAGVLVLLSGAVISCSDDGGGGSSSAPPPPPPVLTDITFYMENTNVVVGGTVTLPATLKGQFSFGGDQDVTPAYTTSNSAIASISGTTLTGVAFGDVIVTASVTVREAIITKTVTFHVKKNEPESIAITLPEKAASLTVGETFTLPAAATVTYTNNTTAEKPPTYELTGSYASLDSTTKVVTGSAAGTANLKVSFTEGEKTVQMLYNITVVAKPTISKIEIVLPELAKTGLKVGDATLATLTLPEKATVTLTDKSTKEVTPIYSIPIASQSYATLDTSTRVVSAVAAGTANLAVSYTEGTGGEAVTVTASYSILVLGADAKAIKSVALTVNPTSVEAGGAITVGVTATYSDDSSEQVTADVTFEPASAVEIVTDDTTGAKTYKGAKGLTQETQVTATVSYREKTGTTTFKVLPDKRDIGISGDFGK